MTMRKKIVISGVLILLLAGALGFFCFWRAPEAENVVWGVSFSQKQAAALGLDWQAAYSALLDDLDVKKIRIAAHWDLLAPRPGEYDFSDLDWQMDEAARAGAKTVLAIGMKTPRWPECHFPEWAKTLDKERQQAAVLALLEAAVIRYRDHPALESWQVENEPLFPFGECPWRDEKFLQKEIALVKSLDGNKRPVVISDSGEGSWWLNAARAGDIAGITMYRRVYFSELGIYVDYLLPPAFYAFKAELVGLLFKKKVICVELQAEPWAIGQKYDGGANDAETMDIGRFRKNVAFARSTGLDEFYLWGGEWWYWMKTKKNRPEFWEEAKALFN